MKVVVHQAGCERLFSDLKIKQAQRRTRLKTEKLEKMTKVSVFKLIRNALTTSKVGADIRSDQLNSGQRKPRMARKNHKSVEALLAVPRYADLLADQDDEDETEQGRLLVTSEAGWRTEMARWIGEVRRIDEENDSDSDGDLDELLPVRACVKMPLKVLFGRQEKRSITLRRELVDEEAALMEALADMDEDNQPDDGAIEIDSEEEYRE